MEKSKNEPTSGSASSSPKLSPEERKRVLRGLVKDMLAMPVKNDQFHLHPEKAKAARSKQVTGGARPEVSGRLRAEGKSEARGGRIISGLNRRQEIVIWIGLAVAVCMGIYPPWNQTFSSGGDRYEASTYHWIFQKPNPPQWFWTTGYSVGESRRWRSQLDMGRIVLQWTLVAFICAGLVLSRK